MRNEDILKLAIEKAERNGYDVKKFLPAFPPCRIDDARSDIKERAFKLLYGIKERIIFSHDFAKAFWGEEIIEQCHYCTDRTEKEWQRKLQQIVLEEDPIKYLSKFI